MWAHWMQPLYDLWVIEYNTVLRYWSDPGRVNLPTLAVSKRQVTHTHQVRACADNTNSSSATYWNMDFENTHQIKAARWTRLLTDLHYMTVKQTLSNCYPHIELTKRTVSLNQMTDRLYSSAQGKENVEICVHAICL